MHHLCMRGERRNFSRHAVAETHADAEEEIACLNRHIRRIGTVHAGKRQEAGIICRTDTETEQRCRRWNAQLLYDFSNKRRGI